MADPPMKISWRNPNSSENGGTSHDALTVLNMMPPIRELRPFESPSKLYPWMWITQCEMHFSSHQIPDSLWLSKARPFLHGEAKAWFDEFFEAKKRELSWQEFRSELCEKFGDDDPVDVMRRYREIQLQRDGEGEAPSPYALKISNLVQSLTKGDNERFLLLLFISGMNDDLQYMVRLLDPTSMDDALKKGLRAEKYVLAMKKNINGGS